MYSKMCSKNQHDSVNRLETAPKLLMNRVKHYGNKSIASESTHSLFLTARGAKTLPWANHHLVSMHEVEYTDQTTEPWVQDLGLLIETTWIDTYELETETFHHCPNSETGITMSANKKTHTIVTLVNMHVQILTVQMYACTTASHTIQQCTAQRQPWANAN